MNLQKAWAGPYDVVHIIESNIRLFHDGDTPAYKSIAVQLRVLLCDTQNPLLPRVS